MDQEVLRVFGLPENALDAAALFHSKFLPVARAMIGGKRDALALVFNPAGHEHSAWRKAAVADLAREAAPTRVNAVAGDHREAIVATLAWLAQSPGITGQLLGVDGTGAGIAA
jgi:hypothetical protein